MGMDVYGQNPTSETGEYFRNNVWWWRPLWNYCCAVGADVISDEVADMGHLNDGVGLDTEGAMTLANILQAELESGRTTEYECKHREYLASIPRETCEWCAGTGVRTDEVGIEAGMPERVLDEPEAILTGRTHGYCNGCRGVGTRESMSAHYPFTTENVRGFVEFLRNCGGFAIC
jgi:hypothetical protein